MSLPLERVDGGRLGFLEGYHHHGIQVGEEWVYRNPTVPARLSDDEIAAADCLLRMGANVRAGGRFYDLAEGAQDQYLTLLIEESTGQRSGRDRRPGPVNANSRQTVRLGGRRWYPQGDSNPCRQLERLVS